ncbi:hypothetical protein [Ferruginibacter sp.]
MKKIIILLPLFVLCCFAAMAQLNKSTIAPNEIVIKELPAKVFTQFLQSAVKSTAYKGSFAKEKKALLKNIESSDPALIAKKISLLTGLIKADMFKNNFNTLSITSRSATVTTMPAAITLLKDVEAGLKPEAITGIWGLQRNAWLEEVNKIK